MSLPESTDQHLWVSWGDYHRKIEQLALVVHESEWQFDHILALARGGLRPADVLSRIFQVPMAILTTSSYREDAGTLQGKLDIASHITHTGQPLHGRVLIVDDLVDSGETILNVVEHIRLQFPSVTELKVAAIWQKASSKITPDYVVDYLQSNPWIHQPFEVYESIKPDQLSAHLRSNLN